jgi:hypothetical protein
MLCINLTKQYIKNILQSTLLIALFITCNSISAKIEQRNFPGSQSEKITERTMSPKICRLENSHNLLADPNESTQKSDTPIKGEKKPRRHIFLKVVGGAVGAFFIFVAYYLRDWDISK